MPKDIAVALGGGGIKGIAHLGVLSWLQQAGYRIAAVAGTSAGALIGAIFSAGYHPHEILEVLKDLDMTRLYMRTSADGPGILGYTRLAKELFTLIGVDRRFDELSIPFGCAAVDLNTFSEVYIRRGVVVDATLASMAIPGVFPPKEIGNCRLVDGGVLDPVPVTLARKLAPNLPVVAVVLSSPADTWGNELDSKRPISPKIVNQFSSFATPILDSFNKTKISQAFEIFTSTVDITSRMMAELRIAIEKPDVIIRPEVFKYDMLDIVAPEELFEVGLRGAEAASDDLLKAFSLAETLNRQFRAMWPTPALAAAMERIVEIDES